MSSYQAFTTARSTEPDFASLVAQLKALDATAGVQHQAGSATYLLKKATPWSVPQIAAAQTAIDSAPASTPALTTQAVIDALPILEKAIVLALIDQLNVIRASLPSPLPAITPAQAITAIRSKAGTL